MLLCFQIIKICEKNIKKSTKNSKRKERYQKYKEYFIKEVQPIIDFIENESDENLKIVMKKYYLEDLTGTEVNALLRGNCNTNMTIDSTRKAFEAICKKFDI